MGLHTSFAAGTYLLGKAATVHFPVPVLGLMRFGIASLGFLVLAWITRMDLRELWHGDRRAFLVAAVLGVLLNQLGFLWGLKYTLPSHAALIYALTPTVVLLMGWVRGTERPTVRKVGGIAMAFTGVAVLFSGRHGGNMPPHWVFGDLLMILALLSWAGYTVLSRPLVLKYGAMRCTAMSIFLGSLMFLPLGLTGLSGFNPSAMPAQAWVGALYLGLITSLVMYLLWFKALSVMEPSRVAIASNGQPILTAMAAWIFLGQPVTMQFGFGAVLVIAGVVLSQV